MEEEKNGRENSGQEEARKRPASAAVKSPASWPCQPPHLPRKTKGPPPVISNQDFSGSR